MGYCALQDRLGLGAAYLLPPWCFGGVGRGISGHWATGPVGWTQPQEPMGSLEKQTHPSPLHSADTPEPQDFSPVSSSCGVTRTVTLGIRELRRGVARAAAGRRQGRLCKEVAFSLYPE